MSDNPQSKVDAEADANVRNLIRAVQPGADDDERITRSDVYATERVEAWRYLIGGGGPTTYATTMKDSDGDLIVYVESIGWSEHAVRVIRGDDAKRIANDLARAVRGDL